MVKQIVEAGIIHLLVQLGVWLSPDIDTDRDMDMGIGDTSLHF